MELGSELKRAKWITIPKDFATGRIERTFIVNHTENARLCISALGFYTIYINGKRVGRDYFQPLNSLFRKRDFSDLLYPIRDEFTYRCYYSIYDITDYLTVGKNTLEIALGNGWYRQTERTIEGTLSFGDALGAIYVLYADDAVIKSDGTEKCRTDATIYSQLFVGEIYDARIEKEKNYRYSDVTIIALPDTKLTYAAANPDRIVRRIKPSLLFADEERKIYDAGENISGFASLCSSAKSGEKVLIRFAEVLKDGELDYRSTGSVYRTQSGRPQIMEDVFIGDGQTHIFEPSFVWHAFRYMEVIGDGVVNSVAVLHSDVSVNAEFRSDSKELNWVFDAFLRTQLNNMHCGVPSDCPHRERLGYTGDGQICAPAGMMLLESREFYRKWIRDIFDSQDKKSGHINHTAPFGGGGGGPGGWGCAAITVPYHYYRQFGDISPIEENYEGMKKWIHYLEEHCENGLVTREEEGGWCLGDWCTLDTPVLEEAFVNTCYFIRSLTIMMELAQSDADFHAFEMLRKISCEAVIKNYYDNATGSFAGGVQGADAFAIFAGLGDQRTFRNLVKKYKELGCFDTGFLATDILCGILFEGGEEDVIFDLLTSHKIGSFGYMADMGATTVWEDWRGSESHNHPMFGACARYCISAILGIKQRENSLAYRDIVINPRIPQKMKCAKGSLTLPDGGVISVQWEKENDGILFTITLPAGRSCEFEYAGEKRTLAEGLNQLKEGYGERV